MIIHYIVHSPTPQLDCQTINCNYALLWANTLMWVWCLTTDMPYSVGSVKSIYSQYPLITILNMSILHLSQALYQLGLILSLTLYITHALTLAHLLSILDITAYLKHLYCLLRQPHKHLCWFLITFFTFNSMNRHPL